MGPIKIVKTDVKSPDLMVAKLSGALSGSVATVKVGKKFYLVTQDGKAREIPADSHTDCLNHSIWEMNETLKKGKRKKS